MKTTTKILIGLTAFPFALMIIGTLLLVALREPASEAEERHRADLTPVKQEIAEPFGKVVVSEKLRKELPIFEFEFQRASSSSIAISAYVADKVSVDVTDGTLTLGLNPDADVDVMSANTLITVTTPNLTEIDTRMLQYIYLRGFKSDSIMVRTRGGMQLSNCHFDALQLETNRLTTLDLELDSSSINRLNVHGADVVRPETSKGRIGSLVWEPIEAKGDGWTAYLTDASVDSFVWLGPEQAELTIYCKGKTKVTKIQ